MVVSNLIGFQHALICGSFHKIGPGPFQGSQLKSGASFTESQQQEFSIMGSICGAPYHIRTDVYLSLHIPSDKVLGMMMLD